MSPNQTPDLTEQIWRELSDRLRQFVRARIGSAADVDDVLQTVFLRIHSRLDDLRHADRLESWAFQIARNAVVDHFRSRRPTDPNVESLIADWDNSSEQAHAELAACLGSLIEQLPDDQQRAVWLYELGGLSQKEIAERERISLSGVKSRIQRGRKALHQMLCACCELHFDRRGNVIDYETTKPACRDCKCD